jgi:transposase
MDKPAARVMTANRAQWEWRPVDLEGLLPADHRARAAWAFAQNLDLSPWYERIEAVEGAPGHPAIDPAILMALWLYAMLEGVGSARALERLCEEHHGYHWICGGVGVNHHPLSDFRVAHVECLDRLLTQGGAALLANGTARMNRVARDGARAHAGGPGLNGFWLRRGNKWQRRARSWTPVPGRATSASKPPGNARRATAVSGHSWCAGCSRPRPSCPGMHSPTTCGACSVQARGRRWRPDRRRGRLPFALPNPSGSGDQVRRTALLQETNWLPAPVSGLNPGEHRSIHKL